MRGSRLLPPPALGERRHRRLSRLGRAVRWRAVLMVPKGKGSTSTAFLPAQRLP
jgi:hypothetical protein